MATDNVLLGSFRGLALIFAYIMVDPLVKEINDTFGSTLLYHPCAVWLTLSSLTFVNTESWEASFAVVGIYELIKVIWKMLSPTTPKVVKIRKLTSRVQNNEKLSDADLHFINEITPENVTLARDGELIL